MIRVSQALREFGDAGSLSARIALWGFVDDCTFLTKAGALGVGFRMQGIDPECLDHDQRRVVTRRLEQALRLLDERVRLYQYLLRRPARPVSVAEHSHPFVREALAARDAYFASHADRLFEVELYAILLFEGEASQPSRWSRLTSLVSRPRIALSTGRVGTILDGELGRDRAHLHHQARTFRTQLDDLLALRGLDKQQLFDLFRRLLHDTHAPASARLKYDTHLDFYVTDTTVECHRDHLRVGRDIVKVLTLKEPPAHTFAGMFDRLWSVPGSLTACVEWRTLPRARMHREIQSRRRHFFNRRVSLVNYLQSQAKPDEMLVDPSAGATVDELGQALTDMEVHGHVFGECSVTLVVTDPERHRVEETAAACVKAVAEQDGALHDETYHLLNAWLAVIPGNASFNVRRLPVLETNAADLACVYAPAVGDRTSTHLAGQEYALAFETEQRTPFFWNLHHHDVGHTLVQGATGSGKSFLVNVLLTHAQKYEPVTVILDLGGSYERVTRVMGGHHCRIGVANRDLAINPFALPPTPEHVHFLHSFVRVLLESGAQPPLTSTQARELYDAVESLYVLDAPQRRLATLAHTLPRAISERLQPWIEGGPYGTWFDRVDDTVHVHTFSCFDVEGLDQYPAVLEPLLFYLLHRASASVRENAAASRLTLVVIDEAWRFVRDPVVKRYITEALKTWRKRNAAMVLITQNSEDFGDGDLLQTVIDSCPTKLFLANPSVDETRARQLFHLNATEAASIRLLRPRHQLLLKRPDVAKILNLHLDERQLRLYDRPHHSTCTPAFLNSDGGQR